MTLYAAPSLHPLLAQLGWQGAEGPHPLATAGATQGRAAGNRLLDETGAVLARKPVRACR
jgi:hypothetical protein